MCGIAGILDFSRQSAREVLQSATLRMTNALAHRGPDDSGIWFDAAAGISLGHRRLSILDLSPAGHQPMLSGSGRFVIVYNGELYNFHALRHLLEQTTGSSLDLRGQSDTEIMLACFERWGVAASLPRFNGMFALAVWDRQDHVLHLTRDRLGEKPLYYGWVGDLLLFASELISFRAHPKFHPEIDHQALVLYLRHNYVPVPHSIYKKVFKLPPGTFLALSTKSGPATLPEPYWSLRKVAERGVANPFCGTDEEALQQLESLLRDSVKMRMLSDVPLGSFLSGGVDSSTITALMQAQSSAPIKTFSIGFDEAEYDESKDAARVARHLGTAHTELHVTPQEAMAVIPKLPSIYSEPFADSSEIPMFLVSQLARKQVTVGLSGDGGDELFGGYTRHVWASLIWNRLAFAPLFARRAAASFITRCSPRGWDSFFRMMQPALPAKMIHRLPGQKLHKLARILSSPDLASMYLGLVSHWDDPASMVLGANEPPDLSLAKSRNHMGDFAQQMMFLDAATLLPDDILTKVDRATMAIGLEARVPLLDHHVVEFAWRLPMSMKMRGTEGKWLLRQLLYRHVPKNLVERAKSGFSIPLDNWLRGPLRPWAEALLAQNRLESDSIFHPQLIREKWTEHLAGRGTSEHALWGVLMFQAWLTDNKHAPQKEAEMSAVACS